MLASKKRILEGQVVSAKMKKTIVVRVQRHKKHPVYKRDSKTYKKFKAHDEKEQAHEGDFVRIIESRPFSKDKKFRLIEVIKNKSSVNSD